MCCLRYEFDAYKDFKGRAPKLNATVQTPAGPAKVVDHDVPREIVSLKVEDVYKRQSWASARNRPAPPSSSASTR